MKTEFDDMLDMLDEEDLTELAAELGVHSILDQAQSRGDDPPVASSGTGLNRPATYRSYSYTSSTYVCTLVYYISHGVCTCEREELVNW